MRKNDKAIFNNRLELTKMLNLRINGYSIDSLSALFSCDPSSIRYHCNKYHIVPEYEVMGIYRILSNSFPVPDPLWIYKNGEKINTGRNYKDYVSSPLL
jgi:hypothetical protein